MTNCKYLDDYIKQVKSSQYRVCKEQIQLVNFIEKVFENEQVYVDSEQGEKYFALQKYFPYELFAWEKFCFILHNCTYSAPGVLRFPDLVCVVGRGAGKNGYLAFEDFALLTPVNGIRNYDIDICATSEEQASTTFNDIYEILENNSTKMQRHFKWNKTEITNIKTNSTIRYRTSNSKTKDGGRPGKVDFDEKHAYENYKLIDVFTTGLGKKAMPRRTTITTMGDVRDGPLDNELAAGLEVLNGDAPDNGTLYFICRLDNEKEVYEQENWYKANPSLQYFPNLLREIQKEFEDWKRDKVNNSSFMTKRMNIPKGTEMHPVTAWENIKATNRPLPDLEGKTCVFGLDYTKTTDFLGAGLLFAIDNEVIWKPMSWYCSQSADLSRIKFPYDKQPDLQRVDGAEIPPQIVAEWLKEQKKHYNIIAGALDNYRYTLLKSPLLECGFECNRKGLNNLKLVRPSDKMLVAPLIASDFANHKIVWGDSALMRWYTNNTSATEDKNGNISYGKIEPKSRKTDGFMAFVAAYTQLDLLRQSQPISTDNFEKFFKVISI